jgi:esterase/lipase superfamily enzyme
MAVAEQQSADSAYLLATVLELSGGTPAKDYIQSLAADAAEKRRRFEMGRALRSPFEAHSPTEEARLVLSGAAANLFEWLGPTEDQSYKNVPVFFATDRLPSGSGDPNKYFGKERGTLTFGLVRVSIPEHHETGRIERPWKPFPESPERHVTVLSLQPSGLSVFREHVAQVLDSVEERKLLIFVHGYRVTFAEAARTLAQMTSDLNFKGIPVLYSWPSGGSYLSYTRDEANAGWTRENFLDLLEILRTFADVCEEHLLAHSMGTRIVFQALQLNTGSRFGQIILAAPDEDVDTLRTQIHRFVGNAARNTVYASSKDVALKISSWIHGQQRAGQVGVSGLDCIDASAVNFSRFGHSYFHDQRLLLDDIYLLLKHGLPPDRRPSIRPSADGRMWLFQR